MAVIAVEGRALRKPFLHKPIYRPTTFFASSFSLAIQV